MKYPIVLLLTLLGLLQSSAATITYTASAPSAFTDWTNTVALPQFNPGIGTLTSSTVKLTVTNTLDASVENLDTVSALTKFGTWASTSALYFTNTLSLSATNFTTVTLSAFDGMLDFSGASGTSNAAVLVNSTTSSVDDGLVTGTGTFPVVVKANASGIYDGSGVFTFDTNSKAAAVVSVTYVYTPSCP